jgi:nucleotide-binding universal stress UspA family protein
MSEKNMTRFKHVLVATDFSEPSRVALDLGKDLARAYGATLHVLHVIQEIPTFYGSEVGMAFANIRDNIAAAAERELDAAVGANETGLVVRTAISRAFNVADAINTYADANDVDIIFVGTHGRSAVSRFLMGSVAERLVRSATRPVLTVRAQERDSAPPTGDVEESTVITGA